jgi:MoxR-like ATPase
MAYPVLRHRISLNYEALAEDIKVDDIITTILQEINIS